MQRIMRRAAAFARNRRGGTAIEYGLVLALIVLVILASLVALGKTTAAIWNDVAAQVIRNGPRR
ncbi:Flp family type IVb pilin [Sphingomonas sp. VNH70]|uniref:Flp family type IVb pilin n=1 Tax=Sphingomonas silueang TaxID=3156617 RepID=UPI0032B43F67